MKSVLLADSPILSLSYLLKRSRKRCILESPTIFLSLRLSWFGSVIKKTVIMSPQSKRKIPKCTWMDRMNEDRKECGVDAKWLVIGNYGMHDMTMIVDIMRRGRWEEWRGTCFLRLFIVWFYCQSRCETCGIFTELAHSSRQDRRRYREWAKECQYKDEKVHAPLVPSCGRYEGRDNETDICNCDSGNL